MFKLIFFAILIIAVAVTAVLIYRNNQKLIEDDASKVSGDINAVKKDI